jgi:ABC-type cobalamin/Fe3+-siderophores transport system ATPase subunit
LTVALLGMSPLEVHQLHVRRQGHAILRGIDLTFSDQTVHFIIGPNGSGKTTLLRCLGQALRYQGEIDLLGRPLRTYHARQLARQVAWVPQDLPAYPQLSTYQFVLMGRFPYLDWLGTYRSQDHQIAITALERLGITALHERALHQLSGGERQKAAIARALCQQTPILMLDEPGQSLDPLARRELTRLLFSLARDESKTILCTTHDLEPLRRAEAHVIGLKAGQVVWQQPGGQPEAALLQAVYG